MKYVIRLSLVATVFLHTSCDPDDKPIFNTNEVKLKATVKDTGEVIKLGDTLKMTLTVPDTVVSNTGAIPVSSLQECTFCMPLFLVDTVSKRAIMQEPPMLWASIGSISNRSFFSTITGSRPYRVVINIKPVVKGIYYLQNIQPWILKMNGNYEARLSVGFDVPNKHFNLLSLIAPYFGGQGFYNAFAQYEAEGVGSYFFRVE